MFDAGKFELAEPREIGPKDRMNLANDDFDYWFKNGCEFLIDYQACLERGNYAKSAFELHQSVECFYSAVALVFTRYKHKSHDIAKLAQRAASFEPEFLKA